MRELADIFEQVTQLCAKFPQAEVKKLDQVGDDLEVTYLCYPYYTCDMVLRLNNVGQSVRIEVSRLIFTWLIDIMKGGERNG